MFSSLSSRRLLAAFALIVCITAAVVRFGPASKADTALPVLPPVTATDTVAVVVGNGDGNADPGETLEYTVTVTNGATDATGVSLSSTLQNITTFVGGSVAIGPAAGNDTYPQTVIGNVSINSASIPYNVLTNDFLGQNPAATITAFDATSANGGQVVLNTGTGTFTYNPPPGFEGTDTFNYTLSNATSTSVGTVTIPVGGMVWFINNNAAACTTLAAGCGRLSNPLSSLAAFQALNNGAGNNPAANDNIFIFESATTYSGGVTLLANQRLTGQDATATLAAITGLTPPTGSTAFPAMNTGGNTTTLTTGGVNVGGGGNTVRGMTINNTATAKINGTNFGTLTVGNNVSPDVTISGTGKALDLNNGTFAATSAFTSVATTSSTSHGMQLISVGGTVAFGSTSVSGSASQGIFVNASNVNLNFGNTTVGATTAGEGVRLESNTGGTRTFGTLSITNAAVQGFTDSGGGNTNVTGLATITNPANVGILVSSKSAGTSVTFANVSNTGSGSHGVHLNNNAGTVTFGDLDITADANQRGILATTNTGTITTTSGTLADTGTAVAVEIVGASSASRTPLNMTLTSVSSTNAPNGILLQNVNGPVASIGFVVNGDGTNTTVGGNSSGGTIANATGGDGAVAGSGIYLSNADEVTIRRMTITGTNQNFGIRGLTVNGFALEYSTVSGTNGTNIANDEDSIGFDGLTGMAAITSSNITGGLEDGMRVSNSTGMLDRLTITGSTFATVTGGTSNNALSIVGTGTAVMNVSVLNSFMTTGQAGLAQFILSNATQMDLVFTGNTLTNNHPTIVSNGGGFVLAGTADSDCTYNIANNSFRDSSTTAVVADFGGNSSTHTSSGRIENNTIGVAGTANSGSRAGGGIGYFVDSAGGGVHVALINNNIIRQYNNHGILVQTGDVFGQVNNVSVSVTNNNINTPGNINTDFNGIHLNHGTVGTDTFTSCIHIAGNNIVGGGAGVTPPNNQEFRLRQRHATTVRLPGYGGSNLDTAAVVTFIRGQNTASAGNGAASVQGAGGFIGGAACTQPAFASPGDESVGMALLGDFNSSEFQVPSSGLFGMPSVEFQMASGEFQMASGEFQMPSAEFQMPSAEFQMPSAEFQIPSGESRMTTGEFQMASTEMQMAYVRTRTASEFVAMISALGEMISPTVYSQEIKFVKSGGNSPLSGETVTTAPTFTIPANKSVVVKYRATVDNGPYAAGINNIDNVATISGSNFANVNSTTASIALDAAPDLSVTANDGGATETQPGVVVTYALGYANATGINLQGASGVTISNTVPANTTFNAASSSAGWSCADNSPAGTPCTNTIGAVAAAGSGSINFAVNVLGNLPATALTIADTATIAEVPANTNGTDLNAANNTATDTDNVRGIWLGGTSTDWAVNTNWSNNLLPNTPQNISVPSGGGANSPSITSVDVTVNNVVDSGKNITIGAGRTLLANLSVALGANNVLGAGTLELASGAPITRTTGQVNCALKKNFINGNFTDDVPESPTAIFTYPVGTATGFSPLTANVTAGSTGSLTVRAFDGTAPAALPLPDATTLNRYWQMTETGNLTASLTFMYLQADVDGVPGAEANYRLIRTSAGGQSLGFQNVAPCPGGGAICVDTTANTIFAAGVTSFDNFWTAGALAPPTAANVTVAGRVLDPQGRGLSNARVEMADSSGNIVYALTNPFGYYRFHGVAAGQNYVIGVASKLYRFTPRTILVADELTDVDFIAEP